MVSGVKVLCVTIHSTMTPTPLELAHAIIYSSHLKRTQLCIAGALNPCASLPVTLLYEMQGCDKKSISDEQGARTDCLSMSSLPELNSSCSEE